MLYTKYPKPRTSLQDTEHIHELYRFAEFGKLASGIFHDIISPLTALTLAIEKLSTSHAILLENTDAATSLRTASIATKHMKRFIMALRKQIKADYSCQTFSINEEIEDAIALLNYKAKKAGAEIVFTAKQNFVAYGNSFKLSQVVTNLISNALDASATHVEVVLSCNQIVVQDNGSGMSDDIVAKIFSTFFTTKESGLGLGLGTVQSIVEHHFKGTISCKSTVGKGTVFTVRFEFSKRNKSGGQ